MSQVGFPRIRVAFIIYAYLYSWGLFSGPLICGNYVPGRIPSTKAAGSFLRKCASRQTERELKRLLRDRGQGTLGLVPWLGVWLYWGNVGTMEKNLVTTIGFRI